MRISELMEQLGACQGVHGDVTVLIAYPSEGIKAHFSPVYVVFPTVFDVGSKEVQYVTLAPEVQK